jgi:diguanylate cyclase (GGDEF)-like protein
MKKAPQDDAPRLGSTGLPNLDTFDYEATGTRNTETSVAAPASTRRLAANPVLTIVEGNDAGRVVRVDRDELVIGRAPECDIVLFDTGVSRKHASVQRRGADIVLSDLGSKNGTFVDGEAVSVRRLSMNDVFHVGPNVRIRLSMLDEAEEKLARQLYDSSMRDALTRTFNRRYFSQRLETEIAFAARHKTDLSVIAFDVDHFKALNDTHGHAAGDEALSEIARAVQGMLRSEDVLARVGGEEFAILLRGVSPGDAVICAERVRAAVERVQLSFEGVPVRVTVSLGVAALSEGREESLVKLADGRLYEAKRAGRNCVRGA